MWWVPQLLTQSVGQRVASQRLENLYNSSLHGQVIINSIYKILNKTSTARKQIIKNYRKFQAESVTRQMDVTGPATNPPARDRDWHWIPSGFLNTTVFKLSERSGVI